MKKEHIINLIKYHSENDNQAFNREVRIIAREFDKMGDYALAQHIIALTSDHNVLVPQVIPKSEEDAQGQDESNNI